MGNKICTTYLCQFMFLICWLTSVTPLNEKLVIQLNGTTTPLNSELYGGYKSLNGSRSLQVSLENINKSIAFIIFQVHSYQYNVTLSSMSVINRNTSINGTNLGLYSDISAGASPTFYIINANENAEVQMYISVHGYNSTAPIPGGCNLEFDVHVSPYLRLQSTPDMITVKSALPRAAGNDNCVLDLQPTFYRLYMDERDFTAESYFKSIRDMITLEKVLMNGDEIPRSQTDINTMRRMFSSYAGTGSVYVVVVSSDNGTAVYVPIHTYGCSPIDEEDSCTVLDDSMSQVLCALSLFTGLFLCYFGHRFFKTEMFLVGMLTGAIITYIIIPLIAEIDRPALLSAALISGVFFGAIWWLFWWLYGLPVFIVMLATMNLGFLMASIVFYSLPGGIGILEVDINFWSLFIFLLLLAPVCILTVTLHASILSCVILGAYGVVYPIDLYLGANLKYILINTVRRAIVPGFSRANTTPPYQWRDAILTLLWIMLVITGFLYQKYQNQGRSPFPPPPRNTIPTIPSRTYPRLYGTVEQRTAGVERSYGTSSGFSRSPLDHVSQEYTERTPIISRDA